MVGHVYPARLEQDASLPQADRPLKCCELKVTHFLFLDKTIKVKPEACGDNSKMGLKIQV